MFSQFLQMYHRHATTLPLPFHLQYAIMLWECMMVASERLAKQHKAATKIQALWRGYSNRPWYNWAFTHYPWEYWRFDIEDMIVDQIFEGVLMHGPEYPSDNSGDGPTRLSLFLSLSHHNAALFSFRFSNMVETIDIQVWTYTMRIHQHEYVGQEFNHHELFGCEEIFADFCMMEHLMREWLRDQTTDDFFVPRPLWNRCLDHLETIESAEIFHDERITPELQELITDMIRLSTNYDYVMVPRPHTDTRDLVPSF